MKIKKTNIYLKLKIIRIIMILRTWKKLKIKIISAKFQIIRNQIQRRIAIFKIFELCKYNNTHKYEFKINFIFIQ